MGSFVPILNRRSQLTFNDGWYSTTNVFVKTSSYTVPNDTFRDPSYKPQLRGWLGRNPILHKGVQVGFGCILRTDGSSVARAVILPEQNEFTIISFFLSPSHYKSNTRSLVQVSLRKSRCSRSYEPRQARSQPGVEHGTDRATPRAFQGRLLNEFDAPLSCLGGFKCSG